MQTPTPYEQREHQLCFFFIQLNRQVSSVRKKSQCAFYVVICLPAPRANETEVVLFLKKTKSASPFCLYSSRHLCSPWHFARRHSVIPRHDAESRNTRAWVYLRTHESCGTTPPSATSRSWAPHHVRVTLPSFRATTRNPGVPARDYVNKSPACSLWTPHRVRGDTMRIGDGEALSSFRATTRNPEIPGHGITQYSRTVWHYSTLCHLQSWAPLRMWGDTVRIGGGEALSSFRATTRNPGVPARDYVNKSPTYSLWAPHRGAG